jgi:GTPase Era involved in 16S rRNA processing
MCKLRCRWLVAPIHLPTVLPVSSNCCRQEIPYGLRHRITSWKTLPGASASLGIECDVIVPRKHLKAIVIGREGKVVKRVSQAAAAEMQQRFQRPVSLAIRVKSSV